MKLARILTIAAAGAALLAIPAAAQDTSANPNYGTYRLRTGFSPDPRIVPVQAGGAIDASEDTGSNCRGFISNAPDVRLHYQAGTRYPLIISVASSADTTLVINGPDGRWYCDDDTGEGVNPSVRFNRPRSGRYEIWVGSYREGATPRARLHISEVRSQ